MNILLCIYIVHNVYSTEPKKDIINNSNLVFIFYNFKTDTRGRGRILDHETLGN